MTRQKLIIGIIGVLFLIQPISAQTWEASKRLTWTSGLSNKPKIATDSNNHIHVVWHDRTPGDWEIYYMRSTDEGASWSKKRLTWTSGASVNPAITVDSNNHIHVVWQSLTDGYDDIYYKKSTDGGATWTIKRLTWTSVGSHDPEIAIDSNNHIYMVWVENNPADFEIFYKKSTDGGTSWSTKRLTWTPGRSESPAIAVDTNNDVHVVWAVTPPSATTEIYYKKSTDGGTSWSTKRLTWYLWTGWAQCPKIALDSNNHISVVWDDFYEVRYKRSTDGGATWSTKRLTWNSGDSIFPELDVDSNNYVHVVWEDYSSGKSETYYKRSTNGGASWSTKRLTWSSSSSNSPAVAVDTNNDIHVVWHGYPHGNAEIYYRKGKQ